MTTTRYLALCRVARAMRTGKPEDADLLGAQESTPGPAMNADEFMRWVDLHGGKVPGLGTF